MACATVFDRLRLASENLPNDIYKLASYRSPWLNAIDRGEYAQGQGVNGKTFTVQRIEPTADEESWNYVIPTGTTSFEGESVTPNNCNVTYNDVPVGFNEAGYHPELFGLKGPTICQDDLSVEYLARAFLSAYLRKLTIRAQRSWEKRYETIYMAATRAVIASTSLPIESNVGDLTLLNHTTTSPRITNRALAGATSEITQEMLDALALELMNEGATNPDEDGYISLGEDGPIFSMIIGIQASQRLLKNNTEFRNDIRYAQMGSGLVNSELMKRLGATRVIKNFRHIPDLNPPRFWYNTTDATAATTNTSTTLKVANAVALLLSVGQPVTGTGIPASTTIASIGASDSNSAGFASVIMSAAATATGTITATFGSGTAGKYTRVPTWTESNATKGKKSQVSTNWKNARFEGIIILTRNVFISEILRPINSVGDMNWSPKNYMGDWKFVTGGNKFAAAGCSDPMEKLAAHFAEFRHAPKPKFPEQGFTVIHRRCDQVMTAVVC